MKWPQVSKSAALSAGGVVLIGGIILAAEARRADDKRGGQASTSPRGNASADPDGDDAEGRPSKVTCPTSPAVEDPTLVPTIEKLKDRFPTDTCQKNINGVIPACLDKTPEACERRVAGIARLFKNAGSCIPKPAEIYCAGTLNAYGETRFTCFDTADGCETYRRGRVKRPKICRIAPKCETVKL